MKKRTAFLSLFIMVIMIFTVGCAKKQEESSVIPEPSVKSSSEVALSSSEPVVSSSVVPSSEPVEPMYSSVSPTTGKGYETEQEFYPIMVTIENASGARPQTGLNKADIIYEFPVESTITRFLCIFNDNRPKEVGPVRSARYYFLYTQKEWDCIYEHFGGAREDESISVYNAKYNWIRVRIDGLKGKYSPFYWRDNSRKAPHNVYSDLTYVKEQYPDFTSKRTYFWKHSDSPSTSDVEAKSIHIPFASQKKHNVEFFYDAKKGQYTRYENGELFKSIEMDDKGKKSQEAVVTNNIIIQYVPMDTTHTGKYYRRVINMMGSGKAEYFINGKYITGKWERKTQNDVTKYYDDKGQEIVLAVGTTWVAIQPTWYKVTFE